MKKSTLKRTVKSINKLNNKVKDVINNYQPTTDGVQTIKSEDWDVITNTQQAISTLSKLKNNGKLSYEELERRLVLLNQLAKSINGNLVKLGFGDENGVVNTCSVAEVDGDGELGANIVNLFLLADMDSSYAEREFKTDAEFEALKTPSWSIINDCVEINEDFLPSGSLTYTVEFDGVDKFRATLEQSNFDRKIVGVEDAPKTIHYKLDKQLSELTDSDREQIGDYLQLEREDVINISDVFMEKSFITLVGVDIEVNTMVRHTIKFNDGESSQDFKQRNADIYLHDKNFKLDLGGSTTIDFI